MARRFFGCFGRQIFAFYAVAVNFINLEYRILTVVHALFDDSDMVDVPSDGQTQIFIGIYYFALIAKVYNVV